MLLAAIVLGLDNDDLLSCVATARDDGLWELNVRIELELEVSHALDVPLGRP